MNTFKSGFADKLDAALDWRESCGYKRDTYLHNFIKFDRFCRENFADETELKREIVYTWLDDIAKSSINLKNAAESIRQFGKYLSAINETAYILPNKFVPKKPEILPRKFTDAELAALFSAIDNLEGEPSEPFINEIMPVQFRLIYSCGLRPNEGRGLLAENVNLDTGEILITNTKFRKDRLIVMSDDMLELVRKYDLCRKIIGAANPYFFPTQEGGAFSAHKLSSLLNKAWAAVICNFKDLAPSRIRVYDLRHRFASARLNLWLDEGADLYVMLPFLSTYMGHRSLAETAYYIHILPENLLKSPAINWNSFNEMFPALDLENEVKHEKI